MDQGELELEQLQGLGTLNCAEFFRARRQLLDRAIQADPENSARLAQLQATIDHGIALSGSPIQALKRLTEQMHDNALALERLSQRLLDRADRESPNPR